MPKKSFRLQTEGETWQQRAAGTAMSAEHPAVRPGNHRSTAEDLELAGGLYGVCIGHMFYAESMFSKADNASKIALAHLAGQFERWQPGSSTPSGTGMIDCQMKTSHLASLGAREIPRGEFIAQLQELIHCAPISDWRFDTGLFR